jgi:2,3-bisphosphoglycerate-independent phosphoglycerate mutase
MILDGRSTEPGSAPALLEKLAAQIREIEVGRIVSVIGRGLALDRDGNYEKTRRAYEAFVSGKGRPCVGEQ